MRNQKITWQSFLNAAGTVLYVGVVSWLMFNGESFLGKVNNFWGPLMILMLFVVSALITSTLVLGWPIFLYFEGKKKEAINLFFYTAGWLILITVVIFAVKIMTA